MAAEGGLCVAFTWHALPEEDHRPVARPLRPWCRSALLRHEDPRRSGPACSVLSLGFFLIMVLGHCQSRRNGAFAQRRPLAHASRACFRQGRQYALVSTAATVRLMHIILI